MGSLQRKGRPYNFREKTKEEHMIWESITSLEQIGVIKDFFASNRTERKLLSKLGAVRMSRKEALDIIKEKKKPPDLYIVMEVDVDNAEERIFFKFYRDCGIKRYASYLDHTKCMKR
eukprot:11223989-Heterocapsa_arctica.AAC.1